MFLVVLEKMPDKKKICVVTGSRAEYGLLKLTMEEIFNSKDLTLQLIVTGSHLSKELGETVNQIEIDGFKIDSKIEILGKDDSSESVLTSISTGLSKFPECYKTLKPDLLLVLGDRYEIFAAVTAALFSKIPVAHIHGGEVTEGAFDESLRHSITKMSHIHFTSNKQHKVRVEQLGENPKNVFDVGSPGVEFIKSMQLLSKEKIQEIIGTQFRKRNYLITFHPETLAKSTSPKQQISKLLKVLQDLEDSSFIFTKANADPGGLAINNELEDFVKNNPERSSLHSSLGQLNYLSLMKHSSAVVGNSSSGIIEAPTLNIPVINIGNRQMGRMQAGNIINCENNEEEIRTAFDSLDSFKVTNNDNPFDGGNTSRKIREIIQNFNLNQILMKSFYDKA